MQRKWSQEDQTASSALVNLSSILSRFFGSRFPGIMSHALEWRLAPRRFRREVSFPLQPVVTPFCLGKRLCGAEADYWRELAGPAKPGQTRCAAAARRGRERDVVCSHGMSVKSAVRWRQIQDGRVKAVSKGGGRSKPACTPSTPPHPHSPNPPSQPHTHTPRIGWNQHAFDCWHSSLRYITVSLRKADRQAWGSRPHTLSHK